MPASGTGRRPMHCLFRISVVVLGVALAVPGAWGQVLVHQWDGDSAGDYFGNSVSDAGDVNNDGFDDLLVGSVFDDPNGTNSGNARVFSGVDGAVLYAFDGDSAGDYFGASVSGAGDVNNDGFDDLLVGAIYDDPNGTNSGSARVFSGVDGAILYTFVGDSAGDYFGGSVSGAGDVNNDGFDELFVGANGDDNNGNQSGSARVFSGVDGALLYTFDGDSAGDYFGGSVSGAGDVDSDGYADMIVGAPSYAAFGSGSARVFSGLDGSVLYQWDGKSPGVEFGYSVSDAGDVNADGFADLIVGVRYDDTNGSDSGSARVMSGLDGSVLYHWDGDSANDMFGDSVSGAGDVNADGYADLIVGAKDDDNTGGNSGSARVFSGLDGSVLNTLDGDSTYDYFGDAVSGAGDVNGDGCADLLVGAPGDDNNGLDSGSASVLSLDQFPDCNGNNVADLIDITSGNSHDNNANGVPDECEEVSSYGASCGGLSATYVNSPTVGSQVFLLAAFGAAPNKGGLFMAGATSLDIDLTAFGAAGCSLYQDLGTLIPALTDGVGSISWQVPIPNDPLLVGVTVYQQWAVFDTSANPLGVTTSEGLAIWIQP